LQSSFTVGTALRWASKPCAWNDTVWPARMVVGCGVTNSSATGPGVTRTSAVLTSPSVYPTTVPSPTCLAVKRPVGSNCPSPGVTAQWAGTDWALPPASKPVTVHSCLVVDGSATAPGVV